MPATGNRRDDLLRDQLPPEEVVLPGAGDVDPATHALLTVGQKRSRVRRRTAAQKRRRAYDRKRKRATYDLPQEVQDAVKMLAERLGCSASDLVGLALAEWLNTARLERLEALRVETPPENIRCSHTFELPPLRVESQAEQGAGGHEDAADVAARARRHLTG